MNIGYTDEPGGGQGERVKGRKGASAQPAALGPDDPHMVFLTAGFMFGLSAKEGMPFDAEDRAFLKRACGYLRNYGDDLRKKKPMKT